MRLHLKHLENKTVTLQFSFNHSVPRYSLCKTSIKVILVPNRTDGDNKFDNLANGVWRHMWKTTEGP